MRMRTLGDGGPEVGAVGLGCMGVSLASTTDGAGDDPTELDDLPAPTGGSRY